jgi:hypothetical protein
MVIVLFSSTSISIGSGIVCATYLALYPALSLIVGFGSDAWAANGIREKEQRMTKI